MSKSRLFYGGIPTAPDVERLMDLGAEPGMVIEYSTIEDTISTSRKESRFYTVTKAWRDKLLRERKLRVVPRGDAFKMLDGDETCGENIRGMHRLGRAAGRQVRLLDLTDQVRLSDRALQQHLLMQRGARALLASSQEVCEKIAAPSPIQTYRKLAPPIEREE